MVRQEGNRIKNRFNVSLWYLNVVNSMVKPIIVYGTFFLLSTNAKQFAPDEENLNIEKFAVLKAISPRLPINRYIPMIIMHNFV